LLQHWVEFVRAGEQADEIHLDHRARGCGLKFLPFEAGCPLRASIPLDPPTTSAVFPEKSSRFFIDIISVVMTRIRKYQLR
jgi:hypothetical protein